MDPSFSNPDTLGFLGNLSLGATYARSFAVVFVCQAFVFVFYHLWRTRRELRRFDEAIKHDEATQLQAQELRFSRTRSQ
jgi:hypothetical protein